MRNHRKTEKYFVKFPKKPRTIYTILFESLDSLKDAVIVVFLIFACLFRVVGVSGSSMNPTLEDGDWVAISGITTSIDRGDIVIVTQPWEKNIPIIKRVIALPGDTLNIDFENGIVYLNGEKLEEDYILEPTYLNYDANMPMTIPEGYVFVMGDNRNGSLDSRSSKVGLIKEEFILGKALCRFYPDPKKLTQEE